jgi:hypothetical protein
MFLKLKEGMKSVDSERAYLNEICKHARAHGLLISMPAMILKEERILPRPAIKLSLSAALSKEQLDHCINGLIKSIQARKKP